MLMPMRIMVAAPTGVSQVSRSLVLVQGVVAAARKFVKEMAIVTALVVIIDSWEAAFLDLPSPTLVLPR